MRRMVPGAPSQSAGPNEAKPCAQRQKLCCVTDSSALPTRNTVAESGSKRGAWGDAAKAGELGAEEFASEGTGRDGDEFDTGVAQDEAEQLDA